MHRPVLSYLHTYRSNAPSGGPFGVFHPCLRPLAPGCTLGRITKNDKTPVHLIKERQFLNCPSSGATVPRNERSIKLSFFGPFVFSVDLSLLEANSPIYRIGLLKVNWYYSMKCYHLFCKQNNPDMQLSE